METAPLTAALPPRPRPGSPDSDAFDPPTGSLPARIGARFPGRPVRVNLVGDVLGYVIMTVLLIGIGLLLTEVVLTGALGTWDVELNRRLAESRSAFVNGWSDIGSSFGDTVTVITVAAVATGVLLLRRAWAHASFLVGALLIEFLSFVTTTFVIDRSRPPVPKLDPAPPTASFPSGHTAASIVLFVSLAVIVTSRTRNLVMRIVVWTLACLLPAAVAVSRMQRGMHHPSDIVGSLIGALGALLFSMLAVRAAVASARADAESDEAVAA